MPIGPAFLEDLKAKELATGLTLFQPGVSWTPAGLDPLPASLTAAQRTAIEEVVAVHNPAKPRTKPPREQAKDGLDEALTRIQAGPIADALNAIRSLL